MKNSGLLLALLFNVSFACTSFGAITSSGTIIGKNRDYVYHTQSFVKVMPLKQFIMWYDNSFEHKNEFYALMSNNDVKMGVNESGLTAIEEDPPFPKDAIKHRRFLQPINGNSEGMILYGVLQNFNSVEEIKPFISQIFSMAAPNFYQFADNKEILTVEVAYGKNDSDKIRRYSYKVINKVGDYFTHTNTYLDNEFVALNSLSANKEAINGTQNRLVTINYYIKSNIKNIDIRNSAKWLLDTKSNVTSQKDKNWCLNTSIFRSNLQGESGVNLSIGDNKIYGTVSSLIVSSTGNPSTSQVYLRMLNSITVMHDGTQLIEYKDMTTNLTKLFKESELIFTNHQFIRKKPFNETCQ